MPVATVSSVPGREQLALQQLGAVLTALDEHIVLLDVESEEIVWCSQGFSTNFPELLGRSSLTDFFSHFDGLSQCRACNEVGEKQTRTVRVTSDQGGDSYFEATLVSLEEPVVALKLEDVTNRTSAIQRYLEDRERLFSTSRTISVSEMATTLAHEINQPIGTVTNLLRGMRLRLERENSEQTEMISAIDQAIDQARFASNIISRIRDYTQSRKPTSQTIDLVGLVCSCAALLDWEIVREHIDLQLALGDKPLMIAADETMLQQVFVNLMRNAIEAMRETESASRRLHITSRWDEEEVEIAIADNGIGLTADAESQLFVPFVSSKPTGMGVGLNICRSFIELHQGRLWLSSNEAGGCTSHVRLPLVSG